MKGKIVQKLGSQPAQARRLLDVRSTICPEPPGEMGEACMPRMTAGARDQAVGSFTAAASSSRYRGRPIPWWEQPVRADVGWNPDGLNECEFRGIQILKCSGLR